MRILKTSYDYITRVQIENKPVFAEERNVDVRPVHATAVLSCTRQRKNKTVCGVVEFRAERGDKKNPVKTLQAGGVVICTHTNSDRIQYSVCSKNCFDSLFVLTGGPRITPQADKTCNSPGPRR